MKSFVIHLRIIISLFFYFPPPKKLKLLRQIPTGKVETHLINTILISMGFFIFSGRNFANGSVVLQEFQSEFLRNSYGESRWPQLMFSKENAVRMKTILSKNTDLTSFLNANCLKTNTQSIVI